MFIGHLGLAYFLKKYDKSLNLGFLFIAVELMDFALMFFLLLGIEHIRFTPGITAYTSLDLYDFPYSHSLLASTLWTFGTYLAARYIFFKKI